MSACPAADRWLLLAEDLLEPGEAKKLNRHLKSCPRCRRRVEALEATRTPRDWSAPPPEILAALLARRREAEPAAEAAPLTIRLGCTYCKGQVFRPEAVHCASCLAPHHADCFEEHGRCAAHACGETRLLTAGRPTARPAFTPWLRRAAALLIGFGALAGGGLLWRARSESPRVELSTRAYPIDGLLRARQSAATLQVVSLARLGAEARLDPGLRRLLVRLRTSPVSLALEASTAEDALEAIAERAEVRLRLPEGPVSEALKARLGRTIDLQLRERSALSALLLVLDMAGLEAGLEAGGLVVDLPRRSEPLLTPRLGESLGPADLLALIERRLGSAAEAGVVEIRGDKVVVNQNDAGHRAVSALLDELRGDDDTGLAALEAWLATGSAAPQSGGRRRLALFRQRLASARFGLRCPAGSMEQLGAELQRALGPGLPLRLHPEALLRTALPALNIPVMAGEDALAAIGSRLDLVFEVDREGLLIRPSEARGLNAILDEVRDPAPSGRPGESSMKPVDLQLRDLSFREAIRAVAAAAERDLIVAAPIPQGENLVLVLAASADPLRILDRLLRSRDLGLRITEGAWVVVPRDQAQLWFESRSERPQDSLDKKVMLDISAGPFLDVLDELASGLGLSVLAADAELATLSHPGVSPGIASISTLLQEAVAAVDARVLVREDLLVVKAGKSERSKEARRVLREAFLSRRVSEEELLVLDAAQLGERIERACEGFVVFRGALPRHRLILAPRSSVREALEALKSQLGCSWELRLTGAGAAVVIERREPGLIPSSLEAARARRAGRVLSARPVRAELDAARLALIEALEALRRTALAGEPAMLEAALARLQEAAERRADVLAYIAAAQERDSSGEAAPLRARLLASIDAMLAEMKRDPSSAFREQEALIAELETKLEEVVSRLEDIANEGARTRRMELANEMRIHVVRRNRLRRLVLKLKQGAAEAREADRRRRELLQRELRILEGRYTELGGLGPADLAKPRQRLQQGEDWNAVFPRGFRAAIEGAEQERRARERAALDERRRAVLGESEGR